MANVFKHLQSISSTNDPSNDDSMSDFPYKCPYKLPSIRSHVRFPLQMPLEVPYIPLQMFLAIHVSFKFPCKCLHETFNTILRTPPRTAWIQLFKTCEPSFMLPALALRLAFSLQRPTLQAPARCAQALRPVQRQPTNGNYKLKLQRHPCNPCLHFNFFKACP